MRGAHFIPMYATAAFLFLSVLYYCSGAWRKIFDHRTLTSAKIEQLNAIANNLSRIILATETESAMLNRDINKFLKIVQRQVEYLKKSNTSKIL